MEIILNSNDYNWRSIQCEINILWSTKWPKMYLLKIVFFQGQTVKPKSGLPTWIGTLLTTIVFPIHTITKVIYMATTTRKIYFHWFRWPYKNSFLEKKNRENGLEAGKSKNLWQSELWTTQKLGKISQSASNFEWGPYMSVWRSFWKYKRP